MLHLVRSQSGAGVEQECHRSGCDRSSLRRAAGEESLLVDVPLGVVEVGHAAGGPKALDVRAGGRQIGVANPVTAARPVRGDQSLLGRFDTADRDHERVGRRRSETSRLGTAVAGRRDDDDPCVPGPLDGSRDRIAEIGRIRLAVEGQVDDSNVELVGVGDHPIDAGDQAGQRHDSVPAGDFDRDDAGVGCHTHEPLRMVGGERRVGADLTTGDDAGHVGAVPERVEVGGRIVELFRAEIDSSNQFPGCREFVDCGHTGVDHRDVDTRAGDALLPQRSGPDLVDDAIHRAEWLIGDHDRFRGPPGAVVELRHRHGTGGDHRSRSHQRQPRAARRLRTLTVLGAPEVLPHTTHAGIGTGAGGRVCGNELLAPCRDGHVSSLLSRRGMKSGFQCRIGGATAGLEDVRRGLTES